jgi:hypothetical protein
VHRLVKELVIQQEWFALTLGFVHASQLVM